MRTINSAVATIKAAIDAEAADIFVRVAGIFDDLDIEDLAVIFRQRLKIFCKAPKMSEQNYSLLFSALIDLEDIRWCPPKSRAESYQDLALYYRNKWRCQAA